MPWEKAKLLDVVIAASVFALVLALWLEFALIWFRYRLARQRRVQERLLPGLGTVAEDEGPTRLKALRLWRETQKDGGETGKPGRRKTLLGRIEQFLRDAGWEVPLHAFLIGLVGSVLLVFVVSYVFTGRLPTAILIAAGLPVVLHMVLQSRIRSREVLFQRQFLDALTLMAQSLRAGHPLGGALRFVGMQLEPPVGEVFRNICQQQTLGASLEGALRTEAGKTSSTDMQMFSTSVGVQVRSGGNLSDMMGRLADVIRERIRLSRRVRVVTAQARLGRTLIAAMPFLVLLFIQLRLPEYLDPLYHTTAGNIMLAAAMGALLLGIWVMNAIIAAVQY
ncbi:type II secretion system F family protein [Planctomycetota bacterium]